MIKIKPIKRSGSSSKEVFQFKLWGSVALALMLVLINLLLFQHGAQSQQGVANQDSTVSESVSFQEEEAQPTDSFFGK